MGTPPSPSAVELSCRAVAQPMAPPQFLCLFSPAVSIWQRSDRGACARARGRRLGEGGLNGLTLFLADVPEPIDRAASSSRVSRPRLASSRATASPTTPPPTTTHPTRDAAIPGQRPPRRARCPKGSTRSIGRSLRAAAQACNERCTATSPPGGWGGGARGAAFRSVCRRWINPSDGGNVG